MCVFFYFIFSALLTGIFGLPYQALQTFLARGRLLSGADPFRQFPSGLASFRPRSALFFLAQMNPFFTLMEAYACLALHVLT